MIQKYMAAAAAGVPNMAARAPALEGQAKAMQKLGKPVHAQSQNMPQGSKAGMRDAKAAMVEPVGTGYGRFNKQRGDKLVTMNTSRPSLNTRGSTRIHDTRKYKREALEMDRKMADLF